MLSVIGAIAFGAEDLRKRDDRYMNDVTISFRVLKDIYEPNEPVPLIVAIANHRPEPIYVYGRDPELLDRRRAWVTDANGVDMPYDPPREQLSLPSDHYMKIEGKRVQVAPISRIEPLDVAVCWMADGLEYYHGHLPEGNYFLEMKNFLIVHEIDNLITRNDTNHRLWFQPKTTSITRCFHPVHGKTKIEIRRKSEEKQNSVPKVVAQGGFAWPAFLGGAILGLILPCAAYLAWKKR
jgi:hypothetical protein